MTRLTALTSVFVEFVPKELADGNLYISARYGTAVHRCCCGCGNEVVTPLSPTDWTLIFDGETVSLEPSVGNWSFECESHYWITKSQVRWADRWSRKRVGAGRAHDQALKGEYYGRLAAAKHGTRQEDSSNMSWPLRLWSKIKAWFDGSSSKR